MNGNSLQNYKDSVICSNTNKGWPLVNQSTDNTGNPNPIYSTNVGTLLNGQNTPKINWGSPTVPDRILYSNGLWNSASSSSSSSKSGNGFAIFGTIISSLGAVFSLVPLISMFISKKDGDSAQNTGFSKSERKEISQNTVDYEDDMSALNQNILAAQGLDENTKPETLKNASNGLMNSITRINGKINEASNYITTAETTKKNANKALTDENITLGNLMNEERSLTNTIETLEKQDNLSDEDKKKLADAKDRLTKVKKEIATSKNTVSQLQTTIKQQDEIIKANQQILNTLNDRVATAKGLQDKIHQWLPDGYKE